MIFHQAYLLEYFSQDSQGLKSVFPLLGELPKAIESHLQVCQLYRLKLRPKRWSLSSTKSLDPVVVTAFKVGFPWEASDPPLVNLPAIVRCQTCGQRGKHGHAPYEIFLLQNALFHPALFLCPLNVMEIIRLLQT